MYLESKNNKASTLLDLEASMCFRDEEFGKSYKIPLMQKIEPVHIKVIDDHLLSFRGLIHKILLVNVAIDGHNSCVVFNIIRSPSNLIILDLW